MQGATHIGDLVEIGPLRSGSNYISWNSNKRENPTRLVQNHGAYLVLSLEFSASSQTGVASGSKVKASKWHALISNYSLKPMGTGLVLSRNARFAVRDESLTKRMQFLARGMSLHWPCRFPNRLNTILRSSIWLLHLGSGCQQDGVRRNVHTSQWIHTKPSKALGLEPGRQLAETRERTECCTAAVVSLATFMLFTYCLSYRILDP